MWRVEKRLNVKRVVLLLSLTSKREEVKGSRERTRGEKSEIQIYIFSIALILFFFFQLSHKAVFCHLLYFIPPVTMLGYLLLYGGQWECSWHWAKAWAVLHLMWIRVQINSLTHSRGESKEGTWASSLQAPCCAGKVYKHVSYSLVCSSMQSSRQRRVDISDLP